MTISRTNADAARISLRGLSGSALASLMMDNRHLFEKHLAKAKASEAAALTGHPQGYFKKAQTHQFNNAQEFNELAVKDSQKKKWLASKSIDKINSKTAKKVKGELTVHVTAENELGNLLLSAISAATYELYSSGADPNVRFLFVTPIPRGYIGREIDRNGNKDVNVAMIVIVVNAAVTTNPQLVTVYPAKISYVNDQTLLK